MALLWMSLILLLIASLLAIEAEVGRTRRVIQWADIRLTQYRQRTRLAVKKMHSEIDLLEEEIAQYSQELENLRDSLGQ